MIARRAVVLVTDLFFATRIEATAARLGVVLDAPTPREALAAIRRHPPDLVILDLLAPGDPLALARALKADPATAGVPIVGFYPHVEASLREAALTAGLDQVLPRSAFSARLPALLAGEGGTQGQAGLLDSTGDHSGVPTRAATPMAHETQDPAVPAHERVRISCPGCGRKDHVTWPRAEGVYHWKCFNCGKEFDLTRGDGH